MNLLSGVIETQQHSNTTGKTDTIRAHYKVEYRLISAAGLYSEIETVRCLAGSIAPGERIRVSNDNLLRGVATLRGSN